jgi:hypothetical protein
MRGSNNDSVFPAGTGGSEMVDYKKHNKERFQYTTIELW